jgi:hypothetical protein
MEMAVVRERRKKKEEKKKKSGYGGLAVVLRTLAEHAAGMYFAI